MTEDDDLRDRFGDELTAALHSRSDAAATVQPVDTVDDRVHRARARRRLLAAAAAAIVGASATAAIAVHTREAARLHVGSRSSTTSGVGPSPLGPGSTGVADWTWVSADHGWALVRRPCGATVCMALRETRDGGRTWSPVRTPELLDTAAQPATDAPCATHLCVSGVRFATPRIGWLFGPAFLETADGGRTWTHEPGPSVTDVEASGQVALRLTTMRSAGCTGGCPFHLEREVLGTGSWRPVSTAGGGSPSLLILRTDAYLVSTPAPVGSAGADLRRSHDSGNTWTAIVDPCAASRRDHVTTSASEAPDGVFVVLCSARAQPRAPFIRISGDGGKTFGAKHGVPIETLGVVRAASAQTLLVGYSTGGTNAVLQSTNGGATWRTTLNPSLATRGAVTLGWENPQTARVTFSTSAIWTTRSAGRHWTENQVAP